MRKGSCFSAHLALRLALPLGSLLCGLEFHQTHDYEGGILEMLLQDFMKITCHSDYTIRKKAEDR